jgi:hypothetical protein
VGGGGCADAPISQEEEEEAAFSSARFEHCRCLGYILINAYECSGPPVLLPSVKVTQTQKPSACNNFTLFYH